jgi:hypothetical protein
MKRYRRTKRRPMDQTMKTIRVRYRVRRGQAKKRIGAGEMVGNDELLIKV